MSYNISVSLDGAKEVEKLLTGFKDRLEEELRPVVRSALIEGTTLAQQYAPVKTGALADSITWKMDQTGLSGSYGPDPVTVVAKVQEHGSDPYVIRPRNAKALKFKVGGRTVFAKKVNHPGVKGTFYLQRSREAAMRELQRGAAIAVQRAAGSRP